MYLEELRDSTILNDNLISRRVKFRPADSGAVKINLTWEWFFVNSYVRLKIAFSKRSAFYIILLARKSVIKESEAESRNEILS